MTDKRIGIRPRARTDVVEVASYIGRDNVTAANRFLDACEATFARLLEFPRLGAKCRTKNAGLSNLRVLPVTGFANYVILYLERPNGIEIVRVAPGWRDLDTLLEHE